MGRALVGLCVVLIAACSGKPAPPSGQTAPDADERALREWFHPRSASPLTDEGRAITGRVPRTPAIPRPPGDPRAAAHPGAGPGLNRTLAARRSALTPLIDAIALSEGVDPALVHAVITQESGYHPHARSPAGAVGLMQLMPATGVRFGVARAARADPAQNVRAGVRYLKWLIRRFHGALPLALAGYNAGEGAVQKYGHQVPPYRETQQYVRLVLANYAGYRRRRQALALEPRANAYRLERARGHPAAEPRDRRRDFSDWGVQ
ncbi:MAG TPA: lytic transglycosylase domain-containing protein [Candidatus Contendobacter sp.]|nr:lytic transglycosylase domain-containing protein [Candidatus Contendobacter sp.]